MPALFQVLQLILGVWMWTLIGRGVLGVLAGQQRERNAAYRVLSWAVWPVLKFTRWAAPRFVVDAHVPWLALLLVVALRLAIYMLFYSQNWLPPAGT